MDKSVRKRLERLTDETFRQFVLLDNLLAKIAACEKKKAARAKR